MNDPDIEYDAFGPNWCVHPGATLADWMNERSGLNHVFIASKHGIDEETLDGVLDGSREINDELAALIGRWTGTSSAFWIAREQQFREGLAAGKIRK